MEEDLSRAVDALPGLVWTALPEGDVDFVNQRWCEYTGLGVDEAYGDGWQTTVHPEDLPRLIERWQSILASGDAGEMEARLRRVDGAYRRFILRVCPSADASGRVVKWCGIGADIDDRWQIEEGHRVRERLFRQIFDDLPTPVALMAPDGEPRYANRYHLDYVGRTVGELNSNVLADSFHPDDRPAVLAAWNAAAETGLPTNSMRVGVVYRLYR